MGWSHSYRAVHRDRGHRHRHGDRAHLVTSATWSIRPGLIAGTATVVISGELDLLSTPSLAEHLGQIMASSPERWAFDLSRLSFIDCAAARLIAGTKPRCQVTSARSCAVPPPRSAASSSSPAWTWIRETDAETDKLSR